jgi:hypothetical protein
MDYGAYKEAIPKDTFFTLGADDCLNELLSLGL